MFLSRERDAGPGTGADTGDDGTRPELHDLASTNNSGCAASCACAAEAQASTAIVTPRIVLMLFSLCLKSAAQAMHKAGPGEPSAASRCKNGCGGDGDGLPERFGACNGGRLR